MDGGEGSAGPGDTGAPPERRRYLDVVEEVLRAVAVGSITLGDRLPNERELATRCDVSRSTVREAFLALELSGVIEVRPGSGCYLTGMGAPVAPLIDSSPRQLLEARQIIEPSVVGLCAKHTYGDDVRRLERLIDDAEGESESPGSSGLARFVRLNLAFHRELAATCGNSILASMMSHLVDVGEHPLWTLVDGIVVRDPHTRARQVNEHRAILHAVAAGDAAGAAEVMTAHLGAVSDRIFGPDQVAPKVTKTLRRRIG